MAKAKRSKTDEKQVLKVPKELISASEFAKRKRSWEQHYAKAKESEGYKRIMRQRQALRDGDMTTVKKLAWEAREAIVNGKVNPQPPFPDPDLEMVYGRLGIKENWEDKIEKAKNEGMTIQT